MSYEPFVFGLNPIAEALPPISSICITSNDRAKSGTCEMKAGLPLPRSTSTHNKIILPGLIPQISAVGAKSGRAMPAIEL